MSNQENHFVPLAVSFLPTSKLLITAREYHRLLDRPGAATATRSELSDALFTIRQELTTRGVSEITG